ncbi:hypothetical protein [Stenotrophobium rhamnosiphilum]|uniref:Uncharacterized protein n=1 Tax=Stenotrophobium rhamnosiphilum TaxID=2029166 RepID=A0A2T5MGN2_9GAMM|nr:hypothetical protein [Stenotrophobium rhamnosiphilum]PTU31745.1 hypothetical protein CJD38_10630 [Stenotrophobium rhamnosiphilum]
MKEQADIFVRATRSQELSAFASVAFSAAQISDYKERESSHYVDGYYFLGKAEDIEMHVMYGDEPGLEQYGFWVSISAESASVLAQQVAQLLSQNGWPCFIPSSNWALKGWNGKGMTYEVQSDFS